MDEFDQMLLDIIDKVFKYSLGEENEKIVFERARYIAIDLTKKQIEGSPSLDSDKHVSRQFEELYYTYYGWPMYWYGPYMWGLSKPVFGFAEKL